MFIIRWCNENSVILTLLLAAGSLITTIFYVVFTSKILLANKKSANMAEKQILQAQESIKMMVDMQLYEKRLEIANNIEKNIYSNTTMEIGILFNKDILLRINNLKELLQEQDSWQKKYDSYLKVRDEQGVFDYNLDYEVQSGIATQEMKDKYKKMLEKCNRIYIEGYDPELYYYDFQEIWNNLSEINSNIEQKQKELKNMIYSIMKGKMTIEDA